MKKFLVLSTLVFALSLAAQKRFIKKNDVKDCTNKKGTCNSYTTKSRNVT